ncbi:unnamed protein product [Phytophthora lilii]|uniref:Unnamed protein product n=1 Tax=Phytophthora lilii TaxID=2077276 RepID=A0A9W6TRR9_9STRA|nr:unnamed protein product [Phytophthora lilii]
MSPGVIPSVAKPLAANTASKLRLAVSRYRKDPEVFPVAINVKCIHHKSNLVVASTLHTLSSVSTQQHKLEIYKKQEQGTAPQRVTPRPLPADFLVFAPKH